MKPYVLCLALLACCAWAEEPPAPVTPDAYTCDNGSRVSISFSDDISGRPQATLHFSDGPMQLPRVPSGSGALYRQGDIRLHTKGDEAIFEDGRGNMRRCLLGDRPPVVAQPVPTPSVGGAFLGITGQVSYRSQIALPPGSILSIRIHDTSRGGAPIRTLVEQSYELDGTQLPIPFSATVDRSFIGKQSRLGVSARIEVGGRLRFVSEKAYPVIADGQATPVDIVLKPVAGKHKP